MGIRILKELVSFLVVLIIVFLCANLFGENGEKAKSMKNQAKQDSSSVDPNKLEKAIFAAGCFWHVQLAFDDVNGVISTSAGYTDGRTRDPTYKQVCYGNTGHAEAVLVIYDPNQVTYQKLIAVFWQMHDPTQENRQGPDVGTQYRSAIFYFDDKQKVAAEESKTKLDKSGKLKKPIATLIRPASEFYNAENYHQKYLEKRGVKSCNIR